VKAGVGRVKTGETAAGRPFVRAIRERFSRTILCRFALAESARRTPSAGLARAELFIGARKESP